LKALRPFRKKSERNPPESCPPNGLLVKLVRLQGVANKKRRNFRDAALVKPRQPGVFFNRTLRRRTHEGFAPLPVGPGARLGPRDPACLPRKVLCPAAAPGHQDEPESPDEAFQLEAVLQRG